MCVLGDGLQTCWLFPLLASLSFDLVFGCLFVKNYQILKIFNRFEPFCSNSAFHVAGFEAWHPAFDSCVCACMGLQPHHSGA